MHFGGFILYVFTLTWGISHEQWFGKTAKVENPVDENEIVLFNSVLDWNENNREVNKEEIRIPLNDTDYLSKSGGMSIYI